MSAYYRDHDKTPVNARLVAYNKAMEQLAQRYPDDYEAQVFYALTLQASASPADTTYANQLKSAAILEKLYDQNPQHPGVTHFLIHAYDYHPLAEKGIPAARRYAGIAPAVPHARHMPSHIYSMVGLWEESIASNASAIEIQPDYYHAADFSVYAHLQLAQDAKAKALTDKSLATADRGDRPITFVNFTAKNAMPARYVLERADWAGAAALPFKPSQHPQADSLTRFTRGLGMARTGDLAGAKAEIEAIKALRAALEKSNQSYWADRSEEQILAISAWIALKEGARDQALKFMRAAADGEDGSVKHVAMENRLYPLRELYAELLLETGQPAAALKEFETALEQTPNRYRTFLGIARAANAAGDRQKASEYYGKLVNLAKNADTERPETREAKAFLAGTRITMKRSNESSAAGPGALQPTIFASNDDPLDRFGSRTGRAGRSGGALRSRRAALAQHDRGLARRIRAGARGEARDGRLAHMHHHGIDGIGGRLGAARPGFRGG